MQKYYYSYNEFLKDIKILLSKCQMFDFEVILGVSRGGLTLAHFMGEALDIRKVYTLNSIHYEGTQKLDTFDIFNIPDLSQASKVLIVDDIVDSGETMLEIMKKLKEKYPLCEFKTASLFYKSTAIMKPDFSVKEAPVWIDFFWQMDLTLDNG
ncbi:MAG: phosphoribosyltransferase family protein [Arcobacteraceae bacterium]